MAPRWVPSLRLLMTWYFPGDVLRLEEGSLYRANGNHTSSLSPSAMVNSVPKETTVS